MMQGLGSGAEMFGKGIIYWDFSDDYGANQLVQVEEYLVPTSTVRLFSLQSYFKENKKSSFNMNVDGFIFSLEVALFYPLATIRD